MADFAVVVPAVQQASRGTREVGVALSAELTAVRDEARALLAAGWLGHAATNFERAWSQWDLAARDLMQVLDDLGVALADTGCAYDEQDLTGSQLLAAAAS